MVGLDVFVEISLRDCVRFSFIRHAQRQIRISTGSLEKNSQNFTRIGRNACVTRVGQSPGVTLFI
jgi:hypothetical protein